MDAGVVFDVRAFCPQLKDTSRDALKDVDEVTLVNLDTDAKRRTSSGNSCPGSKDYGSASRSFVRSGISAVIY